MANEVKGHVTEGQMYIFYFENYCETAELILLKLGGKVPKGKKRFLTQLGSKDQRSEVKNSWGASKW